MTGRKKTKKEEGKFAQLTPLPFAVEGENFRKLCVFILSCFRSNKPTSTGITSGLDIFSSCLCICERIYPNNAHFHRHLKETEGILNFSHILNTSQHFTSETPDSHVGGYRYICGQETEEAVQKCKFLWELSRSSSNRARVSRSNVIYTM